VFPDMLQAQNSYKSVRNCCIALGANLPSPAGGVADTLKVALGLLDVEGIEVVHTSRFFRTPAWPPGSGPEFVNAAASLRTSLSPKSVLSHLHNVEAELGRTRDKRWSARVLDIDLLYYGDLVLPDTQSLDHWINLPVARQATEAPDTLILPHPRLHERGFVLLPLMDISADWVHPRLNKSVAEMTAELDQSALEAIHPLP
jgi:2-amino-4-hydroxy-6-hydroxymethyldihydropteridine diphosphokinase